MVMADIGDRDRGRRRRRRGGRKDYYDSEPEVMPLTVLPSKHPMILTKPSVQTNDKMPIQTELTNGPEPGSITIEKPPILLKARSTDNHRHSQLNGNLSGVSVGDTTNSPPIYSIQRPIPTKSILENSRQIDGGGPGPERLAPPPDMTRSIKLVDESFNWCESGMEMLLDQTDFLVVGVIGLQGVGKSSILSHLATGDMDLSKGGVGVPMRMQAKDMRDVCQHQTMGIDMYVASERTIYLDTQPMLSASILHYMIQNERKYPAEFTSVENCIEIQSLQIASFMMTVCNVVLVVADWFIDTNLIRFLRTAEMLKPPSPGHDSTMVNEYFPNLVFLMNRADRDDFSLDTYTKMQATLDTMMDDSKLHYKGGIHMAGYYGLPGLTKRTVQNTTNLCLLPERDTHGHNTGGIKSLLQDYRGHPGFESVINSMRKQILSVPRHLLTHTTLSEKNWFHYAARTWDGVKKSQMFLEYNRLLP